MKKRILFIIFILSMALNSIYGQDFTPLVNAGDVTHRSYSDYYSSYNFRSGYFYCSFQVTEEVDAYISHCGSEINSSNISLYASNGRSIAYGSTNTSTCDDRELASLEEKNLQPGVYYILSGFYETGMITINIDCPLAANPTGNKMSNAIDVGTQTGAFTFSDTRNTNNYTNEYQGQSTKDVFYKFTLTIPMDITISHCGSEVSNTYVHLLNASGTRIAYNDDYSGPGACSNTSQSYLKMENLAPGTYYIVSEGYNSNGRITTNIEGQKNITLGVSGNQNYMATITPTVAGPETDINNALVNVQYMDGLGRPMQTVQANASPSMADLITFQEYDVYGRESKAWLPAVATANNGAFVPHANLTAKSLTTYGNDSKAFNRPTYETSPLNRLLEQYGPGQSWQDYGKAVRTAYFSNSDSYPCKLYNTTDDRQLISISRTSITANYSDGQIHVTQLMDEDNNISYAFKDKLGQAILTRQMKGAEAHDTYYIYDSYGNLRVVLPPLATDNLNSGTWEETHPTIQQYAYLYKYDKRNRCIAKKLPGAEWIYYIYDKADRIIFTQDGVQRLRGEWSFNIPDEHERTVLSGTCTHNLNHLAELDNVVTATWANTTNANKGYNISGISLNGMKVLTVNYYDQYDFMGKNGIPASNNSDYMYESMSEYGIRYTGGNQGLFTGSITALLDESVTTSYLPTVMYYDNKGQVIQMKSGNHLNNGVEKEYMAYTFTGQLKQKKHIHSATGKSTQTEYYTYAYDHAGRLIKVEHQLQVGSTVNDKITLAEYRYDQLGRLSTKKPHGSNEMLYSYNIRNWVTDINSSLFTQNLYYNTGYGTPYYNGNISSMTWKAGSQTVRGYTFNYDGLNRMTEAMYGEGSTITNNQNRFTENVTAYDKHGNILGLQRYGKKTFTTYGLIDNPSFSYNGNQMKYVNDAANEYAYDPNGNMIKDNNKNITGIQYNILNLPKKVELSANRSATYLYDAAGVKRQVAHKGGGITKTTDYCGNVIYENGTISKILTEEGYITLSGTIPTYHYYLKDHLGNNRVVLHQNGLTVEQVNHYYPFGGLFDQSSEALQGYKYNGKELDQTYGINLYDYSARYMDGSLGRFTTMDPHAESYYAWSPYHYAGNNPIRFIDPTGMDYWSTNDPDEIRRFLASANDYAFQGGATIENFDYSSWNHATDAEFTGNLTFNDETNTFYSSYGYVDQYGIPNIVGVSIKASNTYDKNALIEGPGSRWARKVSGGINNTYPEFDIVFGGFTKVGRAIVRSFFSPMSTTNTFNAGSSGFVSGGGKQKEKMGRAKGNMSGNHDVQKKQIDDLCTKHRLTKGERRQLHDMVTGEGYGYHEIEQIIKDFFK